MYQNARDNSDEQNARIELGKALGHGMTRFINDDMELFRQFSDNEDFKRWMTNTVFALTYQRRPPSPPG